MGVRTKTLITVLLVGVVIGVVVISTENTELFKGQIFDEIEEGDTTDTSEEGDTQTGELPDLIPDLQIIEPESEEDDIEVQATIENIGKGALSGGETFIYTIKINDVEVFSNSDTYSALDPGDSFSFVYPIPRSIYQYPNQGNIKFTLDTENAIQESNKENNSIEKEYNF